MDYTPYMAEVFSEWKAVNKAQNLFAGITQNIFTKYCELFTRVKLTPCKNFGQMLLVGIINDSLTRQKTKNLQIIVENLPNLTIIKNGIDQTNALNKIQTMLQKVISLINQGNAITPPTHLKVFESIQAQDILSMIFRRLTRTGQDREKLQEIAKKFDLSISVYYGPQRMILEATSQKHECPHIAFIVYNTNRFFIAESAEVPEIPYVPSNNNETQYASVASKKPGIPAGQKNIEQGFTSSQKNEQLLKQRLLEQQQKQILNSQLQNQQVKNQDKYPDLSNVNKQTQQQYETSMANGNNQQKKQQFQDQQESDKMNQSASINSLKKAQYPDLKQTTQKNSDTNNLEKSQQINKQQIPPRTQQQTPYEQPQKQIDQRFQPFSQQQQPTPAGKPTQLWETGQDKNNEKKNTQKFCCMCQKERPVLYTNPSCRHEYCVDCLTTVYIPDRALISCFRKYCNGTVDTLAITNFVLDVVQKQSSPQQSFKIECAYCNQMSSIEIDTKPEYYKCSNCSKISCLMHPTYQQLEKCFCKCPKCLSETVQVGKMKSCPRCKISKCTKCLKSYPQMEDCQCKCEFCQKEQTREGQCCPCTKDMCSSCFVSLDLDTVFKPNPNCKLHFLCNPCYFQAILANNGKIEKQGKGGGGEYDCVFCMPA